LQTDTCHACATHGLRLLWIGILTGQKTLLFKNALESLQQPHCKITSGHAPAAWMPSAGCRAREAVATVLATGAVNTLRTGL